MKKQLLCAVLASMGMAAFAQPALTQSKMLPFGSTFSMKTAESEAPVDTTIKGANVTWDFTALTPDPSGTDLNIQILSPASTPFGSSFPNANYAYRETPDIAYRYFNLSATKFERVGSYATGPKGYSDPQVELTFPLTLGTQNNDTWENSSSSSGGTYDFECIGHGKLKLPGVTYDSALMVRAHIIEDPFIDIFSYFWYSAENGAILLQYVVGDGLFVGTFVQYTTSITTPTTAVAETGSPIDNLIYSNPVKEEFKLSFTTEEEQLEYTLVDQLGRVVVTGAYKQEYGTMQNLTIDMDQIQQGMYFLNLKSVASDKSKSIKLLKQ
jgi:hypothetical protein